MGVCFYVVLVRLAVGMLEAVRDSGFYYPISISNMVMITCVIINGFGLNGLDWKWLFKKLIDECWLMSYYYYLPSCKKVVTM